MNARYKHIEKLRDESAALVDRFGVEGAKSPPVVEPAAREAVVTAADMIPTPAELTARRPSVETCEFGFRGRRDYAEVYGTEAHRIIMEAGVKPFRALTPSELNAVEAVVDAGDALAVALCAAVAVTAERRQEMLKREAIAETAPQRLFGR